jgi:hypothetical protein
MRNYRLTAEERRMTREALLRGMSDRERAALPHEYLASDLPLTVARERQLIREAEREVERSVQDRRSSSRRRV